MRILSANDRAIILDAADTLGLARSIAADEGLLWPKEPPMIHLHTMLMHTGGLIAALRLIAGEET